jgi:hypothetical protein
MFVALAVGSFLVGNATFANGRQNQPDIGGLFGAIINHAMDAQLREQWGYVSDDEQRCLARQGEPVDSLLARGISPDDPRIYKLYERCQPDRPELAQQPSPQSSNSKFAVEGLAAGGSVHTDSEAYSSYKCRKSIEFPGFKWCAHSRFGKDGLTTFATTILHSADNVAAFVLEDVRPAYFAAGDSEREIARLSKRFGLPAHPP